ncbi:hypothetical protein ACJIZ3_014961 [Penstemon smallii]|uniref:Uncharacterized protein n=1 Tax=Penstemon smallii TaxID=265156 RepID=A0ABD3RL88_9LAMI
MDTLFRLVSLQSDNQSFNSSRTSSSSRSSKQNPYHQEEEQECFNFYMDDEDFSSSSSRHYNPYQNQPPQYLSNTPTPTTTTTTGSTTPLHHHAYDQSIDQMSSFSPAPRDVSIEFSASLSNHNGKWASEILIETSKAIADRNSARVQQLMWMLNELSSPYGDIDQKLASYFLQAFFSRMTDSGAQTHRTLSSASEKTSSFDSTRKMILKFQEVSPWTMFGHVACNGAIMEAFEGESKLHIIDISNTYCTQWPTLFEAIATKTEETPSLRLTTVVDSKEAVQRVMKEIGSRIEKFARLMGDLSELNLAELDIKDDEAVAVNCVGTLHSVTNVGNRREYLISVFRRLLPTLRIVTVVEEEADFDFGFEGFEFVRGFEECLRWFRIYFEALDETFSRTSNERLMLERAAGRAIVDLVARPPEESVERRDTAARWSHRMSTGGFSPLGFSEEVNDDVRALLRRYKEGWSMVQSVDSAGIFLCWKDQPVVWASAWKP